MNKSLKNFPKDRILVLFYISNIFFIWTVNIILKYYQSIFIGQTLHSLDASLHLYKRVCAIDWLVNLCISPSVCP